MLFKTLHTYPVGTYQLLFLFDILASTGTNYYFKLVLTVQYWSRMVETDVGPCLTSLTRTTCRACWPMRKNSPILWTRMRSQVRFFPFGAISFYVGRYLLPIFQIFVLHIPFPQSCYSVWIWICDNVSYLDNK